MLLRIGQRPEHGFDEPLGLLSDCHRRIEHFLAVLRTIADQANGNALSAVQHRQLEGALTYFATAAPRHTADEEESLFPRLQELNDRELDVALELVRRLESDHAEANAHHAAVDGFVRQWLGAGLLSSGDFSELKEHLTALDHLYRRHIAAEDQQLFPEAARVLSTHDLQTIGREMAARRGLVTGD